MTVVVRYAVTGPDSSRD